MTTERATEVLKAYVKWFDRSIEADVSILTDEIFGVAEFGKALDKAIEVMGKEIYTDMISVADLNTLNELRVKQNNLKR